MKFSIGWLLLVLIAAPVMGQRVWTDATGQTEIEAEYLGMQQGRVALKTQPHGEVVHVPVGTLSEADQEWVRDRAARDEAVARADGGQPDRFTEAILDAPQNPENYIARGLALTNQGDFEAAVKDFTKAIELDPENQYAYNGRGTAYHGQGNLIAAQQDFNQAIQLDPELVTAYRRRGENLRKLALDPDQSVPELDQEIERWSQYWNHARQSNLRRAPWQPLNATKGDVSRPTVLMQMANVDFQHARELERHGHHGGHHHGGHGGGHGPGCSCDACSGQACAHCNGSGCAACGEGSAAPALGVYPPEALRGDRITLVANPALLAQGMPTEARPGRRPDPNAPRLPLDSVDFYRDVTGDGAYTPDRDQYLGTDSDGSDGFSLEVSTSAFPPGPQRFFAVPRGMPGTGSGASPQELAAAAESLERAAQTQRQIALACDEGKDSGLSEDQSRGLGSDQQTITNEAEAAAEKVAETSPEIAELLAEARTPMRAVRNLMTAAQRRPGEESRGDAEKAAERAHLAAEKLAEAAARMQEAAETAMASEAEAPGRAPANAVAGQPASGTGEILAAAPIGPRGSGPGGGPGYDRGDRDYEDYEEEVVVTEEIIEEDVANRALEYIAEYDYDSAVYEYDRGLQFNPRNVELLRDRAATQMLRGSYDYAVRDYDRLLSLREEPSAELYYNRGCAHLAAGRLNEAISDFTKSISMNEVWSLAYNNRGTTYARLGDYQKAVADFTRAIELEPDNRLAYRNRALAFRKLGEIQRAQEDLQYAVQLSHEE